MKRSFLFTLIAIVLVNLRPLPAQIMVDGKKLNEMDTKFVELIVSRRAMTQEIQIMIDYGQYIDYSREFSQTITSYRGERLIFRSIVHALNVMDQNGWEFLTTYMAHTNNYERFHYLFRRKEEEVHK